MKIEDTILKLRSVLAESKKLPGFKNKVILDAEELSSILNKLAESVPADIAEAQEIIIQRESVINQAHLEARRIREASQQEASEIKSSLEIEHQKLVSETEVLKTAHKESEGIKSDAMAKEEKLLSKAKADCEVLFAQANTQAINQKEGADQYAQETLFALEEHLSIHLSQVRKGIDVLNKEVPSSMAS
jgi:hypothetical protein